MARGVRIGRRIRNLQNVKVYFEISKMRRFIKGFANQGSILICKNEKAILKFAKFAQEID